MKLFCPFIIGAGVFVARAGVRPDGENPLVSDYFMEEHPAVLRLVRMVVEDAGHIPVAVCGELARQLDTIPTLLKLGIRSLSVAPPLVPGVKEAIRQISL